MKRYLVTIDSSYTVPTWIFDTEADGLRAFRLLKDKGADVSLSVENSVRTLNITIKEFIARSPFEIGAVYPDNGQVLWMNKDLSEETNRISVLDGVIYAATNVSQAAIALGVDILERFKPINHSQYVPSEEVMQVLQYTEPKLLEEAFLRGEIDIKLDE